MKQDNKKHILVILGFILFLVLQPGLSFLSGFFNYSQTLATHLNNLTSFFFKNTNETWNASMIEHLHNQFMVLAPTYCSVFCQLLVLGTVCFLAYFVYSKLRIYIATFYLFVKVCVSNVFAYNWNQSLSLSFTPVNEKITA